MTREIDTAMILCAGLGTRMRPLTDDCPKPLIPFLGRAMVDHILDRLKGAGFRRVVINVHYLADRMERHVRARDDLEIIVSDERAGLLDTGGGIAHALAHLGERPFLVHNADSIWFEPGGENIRGTLDAMRASWDNATLDTLLLTVPWSRASGFHGAGDFFPGGEGYGLDRRGERESAPLIFAGVSLVHPRLFAGAPSGAFSLNRLWDAALATGRLGGIALEGRWFHIGDPQALASAERLARGNVEGMAWHGPSPGTCTAPSRGTEAT